MKNNLLSMFQTLCLSILYYLPDPSQPPFNSSNKFTSQGKLHFEQIPLKFSFLLFFQPITIIKDILDR